ncbi:MAG: peptide chain release factor family protein [Pirellula sp.]
MHPSRLPLDQFEQQCRWVFSRASGPGGQHRNKVETAVTIEHLPSGIRASATEERSQSRNRQVALQRLRLCLAVEYQCHRSDPGHWAFGLLPVSDLWQSYCRQGRLKVSLDNEQFPAILAEAFEALIALEYHLPKAAEHFKTSATQLVRLLASYPPAFAKLNQNLVARGLSPRTVN